MPDLVHVILMTGYWHPMEKWAHLDPQSVDWEGPKMIAQ